MKTLKTVATILSMLMTLGFAGAASARIFTGFYDFADTSTRMISPTFDVAPDQRRGPRSRRHLAYRAQLHRSRRAGRGHVVDEVDPGRPTTISTGAAAPVSLPPS